jgi:hypothetical protein
MMEFPNAKLTIEAIAFLPNQLQRDRFWQIGGSTPLGYKGGSGAITNLLI